ncbi:hypothetical protein HDU84_002637 [Entophlyctis sp. JEL0112]|nr:hypothetical protein HDU84_002637 [Entophlyctis sp. JEL0112]
MTNSASPAVLHVLDADSDSVLPQPRSTGFFPAAPAGYARVDDDEADKDPVPSASLSHDASLATATVPGVVPQQRQTRFSKAKAALLAHMGRGTDGVFANLGAVGPVAVSAEAAAACPPSDETTLPADGTYSDPPSYRNVFTDAVAIPETDDRGALPSYVSTSVTTPFVSQDGEVLVEGLPVGDFFAFFVNLIVSISFDFFGYMMTTLLATSHAARCGSRSGLGITLIRYGMLVLEKDQEVEENTYRYDPDNYERVVEVGNQNDFIAYIMIIIGFILMMRANTDYIRAQRIKSVMLVSNSAESNQA